MKTDVLLGLQWGDEGKGKVVDVFSPDYDIVARFQGGPNAGHTIVIKGDKHVLHHIPSGIFNPGTECVIGNGVVLDPLIFQNEIEKLEAAGIDVHARLLLSRRAHIILPTHKLLDAASEQAKGEKKIGSTLRGIGPTYMDKTGRNGIRAGDLIAPDFMEKYRFLVNKHLGLLDNFDFEYELESLEAPFLKAVEALRSLTYINSEYYLNSALKAGKNILAEGAQGTLLDIDFGSYPFVTSSNTVTAGACLGLGVAPSRIGKVFGIFKAYCTRVGSGPFPTELFGEEGESLRQAGGEFGATTGRPRRCGWLDLPLLKYVIQINGVTDLIMTKADVLAYMDEIALCYAYEYEGKVTDEAPFDLSTPVKPLYKRMSCWKADITALESEADIPAKLKEYISYIEAELEVPVSYLSFGPGREQILKLHG